ASSAKRHFTQMLDRKETAFLGLRGLLTQALKEGDRAAALDYARRAHAINPQADWLTATLFDLEAREGQWSAAEATLAAGQKAGAFSGGEARRKKAVLLLERARAAGESSDGLKLAYQAFQADPGFPAAAAHYARALMARGKAKKATAALIDCWRVETHPDLAQAWMELLPDAGDPLARVRHAEKLLACRPDAAAGHLLLGEVALDASLWGQARTHLTAAAETKPSARAYRLLARLEEAEGTDPLAIRDWLAKAAEAPGEPVWSCRQCGTAAPFWSALCPACGGFDSLAWVDPAASRLPAVMTNEATAE
ncbi:MAG: heme biosynthesis protein HemY, partial [Alphaproteobacteria bacterium]|nr:heme biosynthesis protein HemY [Alphaproteobacteria bacterium]